MITLIPIGGLANRMRAVASAFALARSTGHELRVVWFRDRGLNCRFARLFDAGSLPSGIRLTEASGLDALLYDRPRRRNLRVPLVAQSLLFDSRLYENEVAALMERRFDFVAWAKNGAIDSSAPSGTVPRLYIATYSAFLPYPDDMLSEVFRPVDSIRRKADDIARQFDGHTTGVHIRRSDNAQSIALSPLSLFVERMEREIQADPLARFYVASDSEEDKEALRRRFGERVLTHRFSAERSCPEGIEDALAEMLVLSSTRQIIGSCWSSFSEIAAQLSGIPCIILKKDIS